MTGLSDHVWGISAAQDRVLAQVSGLPPSKAGKRLFMVLQAFIDDSYNANGVFVLAGYIATAESWLAFSKDWEQMLPYGVLDDTNRFHFKMQEMAINSDRMMRVPAFYRIIETHVLCHVSCALNISELRDISNRLYLPNRPIDWGILLNPFYMSFRGLLDMFHSNRHLVASLIPPDQPIDFYFDNQSEKRAIISSWDDYVMSRPVDIRALYGSTPRFEDDKEFLPLQAADLWAWWVRKWHADGTPEKILRQDFGFFEPDEVNPIRGVEISMSQEEIMPFMKQILRGVIGPSEIIYERASMIKRRPDERCVWGRTAYEPRVELPIGAVRPLLPEAVRLKHLDDTSDKLRKMMQSYTDRLTLENLDIAKDYISARKNINLILIFAWQNFTIAPQVRYHYTLIKPAGGVVEDRLRSMESNALQPSDGSHAHCRDEHIVLVNVCERSKSPQTVPSTIEWLKRADQLDHIRRESPYFSLRDSRFKFISIRREGEVKVVSFRHAASSTYGYDHLVEARPQVVSSLSDEHIKRVGDGNGEFEFCKIVPRLRIKLLDNSIRVACEKSHADRVDLIDALVGPFDF